MQVVYSGGSSTPTPSPHLQRKAHPGGYGRPVMPGYILGHQPPQVVVQRSREKLTEGDTSLRDSIPAMSKPLAVACLIFNIVMPGLGTFVSGLTVLCGAHVRPKGSSRRGVVWVNSGVALLQFLLTFLLLLGWIWSIMWGTAFLTISDEYYKKNKGESGTSGQPKPSPKTEKSPRNSGSASPRQAAARGRSVGKMAEPGGGQLSQANGVTVATVGAGASASSDIFLAPSTSNGRSQPMIILQEAPVSVSHSDMPCAVPTKTLMHARTRHEKILQRQMSDNELSPFILTHQKLEAIVIHDAPFVSRHPRPQLSAVEDSDPDQAPLPKV